MLVGVFILWAAKLLKVCGAFELITFMPEEEALHAFQMLHFVTHSSIVSSTHFVHYHPVGTHLISVKIEARVLMCLRMIQLT